MDNLISRIEIIMNEEQLFRNPYLTVKDVAQAVMTNRFYVSRAFNKGLGVSFTQYINRKRIEFSIDLMRSHPNMPLESVASESGFISQKSFFIKFKEIMNDSPRAYMKKNI